MPKFKIGDVIVNIKPETRTYDRIVIGNSSDGQVVYEYRMDRDVMVGFHNENAFVLKPIKKEGWINIYGGDGSGRPYGGDVYTTKEDALRNNKGMLATLKIEWEG